MSNLKKVFTAMLVIIGLLFIPKISAEEFDTDYIIKKISSDMKTATFNMKKPETPEDAMLVNLYVNNILAGDDYNVFANCEDTICTIDITSLDYSSYKTWDGEVGGLVEHSTGWKHSYELSVTFETPIENKTITKYLSQLKEFDPMDATTYYIVDDLSLINYYLTSDKSELWNNGAAGRALKYSTINDIINGSNVSFDIEIGAGNQDETLMFESAFGEMAMYYNGSLYGAKQGGLYLKRVIYIPNDTDNSTGAYIKAAQKRINDYLGNETSVVVSYGGLLTSLDPYSEDSDYPIDSDGNYYNIKVGDRTYKFYIVKADSSKLVEPVYEGMDLNSNIQITSEDSTIPLDTSLIVKTVDEDLKGKIGTENYVSYDISLYSKAKGANIEKLDSGKFLVKIPIPSELNGKDLIIYYIAKDGTIEEYQVTVKDNFAIFETNHFSTYTLAEKVASKTVSNNTTANPNTGDNIVNYIIAFISCIIVMYLMMCKKQEN